jgi:hypothetical protein
VALVPYLVVAGTAALVAAIVAVAVALFVRCPNYDAACPSYA